jgi:hypothetical protein
MFKKFTGCENTRLPKQYVEDLSEARTQLAAFWKPRSSGTEDVWFGCGWFLGFRWLGRDPVGRQ